MNDRSIEAQHARNLPEYRAKTDQNANCIMWIQELPHSESVCVSSYNEWLLIVSIINEGHRTDAASTLIDVQWFTR